MTTKTIKDVDEDSWNEFKGLANENKMNMGRFFRVIVDGYKSHSEKQWDKILSIRGTLSDSEADELQERIKKMRRERGFR